MSDGEFAYVGLLLISGLIMALLAVRGFGQHMPARIADGVLAAAFVGLGAFLLAAPPDGLGTGATFLFIVPVLALAHMGWASRRASAGRPAAGSPPQMYAETAASGPRSPFPPPPPPLSATGPQQPAAVPPPAGPAFPPAAPPAGPAFPPAAPPAGPPHAVPGFAPPQDGFGPEEPAAGFGPSQATAGFGTPQPGFGPASAPQPGTYNALPTLPAGQLASERESAPVGAKRPPMPSGLAGAPEMPPVTFQPRPSGLAVSPPADNPPARPPEAYQPPPTPVTHEPPHSGLPTPPPSPNSAGLPPGPFPPARPATPTTPGTFSSGLPTSPAGSPSDAAASAGRARVPYPPDAAPPPTFQPGTPHPAGAYWTQPAVPPEPGAGWAAAGPTNPMPYAGGQPGDWQQAQPGSPANHPGGHHGYAEPPRPDESRFGDYQSQPQTTQPDHHHAQEPGTRLRQPAYLENYDPETPPDHGRHRATD